MAAAAIARIALGAGSLEDAAHRILGAMEEVIPSSGMAIALLDADEAVLHFVAGTGSAALSAGDRTPVAESVVSRALESAAPVHVRNVRAAAHPDWISRAPDQAALLIPLVTREQTIGVLTVTIADPRGFPDAMVEDVVRLAAAAALALDVLVMREKERAREAQLRETEKLAALGQLVAGVAHEINNPLTGISAFAQLLADDPALGAEQMEAVRLIKKEADRAGAVVRDLLAFARKEATRSERIDLNAAIEETLRLRAYALRTAGVEIVTELAPDLPPVAGEERKLQHVVLNLIVNAEHAMQQAPVRRLTMRTCHRDDMIVLEVVDTGTGMAPEVQQRMFEPFFTTKPEGVGTGLGLSVSYGIIRAHGGSLGATSAPGSGTTFRVTLPAAPRGDTSDRTFSA